MLVVFFYIRPGKLCSMELENHWFVEEAIVSSSGPFSGSM